MEMEMRCKLILVVSLTLVWCLGGVVQGFTYEDKEVETEAGKSAMFERWRSHHKMEGINKKDKKKQYEAFKANLEHVHNTNKASKPYKLEMNRFAGMHNEEFKSKHAGLKASPVPKRLKGCAPQGGGDCPPCPPKGGGCPPKGGDCPPCPPKGGGCPPKGGGCPPDCPAGGCPPNGCDCPPCPPKGGGCPPKGGDCPPKVGGCAPKGGDCPSDCPAGGCPPKGCDCPPCPPKGGGCPPGGNCPPCPPSPKGGDCPPKVGGCAPKGGDCPPDCPAGGCPPNGCDCPSCPPKGGGCPPKGGGCPPDCPDCPAGGCPPNGCDCPSCPPKDGGCPPQDGGCPPKGGGCAPKGCDCPPDCPDCPAGGCPPNGCDCPSCPPKGGGCPPCPPQDGGCPAKGGDCPAKGGDCPPCSPKDGGCPPKGGDCPPSPKGGGDCPPPSDMDNWPYPFKYRNATNLPPAIDWRTKNVVTPIKNQGQCGCCYAFSACDAVECVHAIEKGELIVLSPKEIVDCAKIGGCNGGTCQDTFKYVANHGGLTTMKNYPYKDKEETCKLQKANDIAVEIHGYEDVPRNHEPSLEKAVAHQPVSVSTACEQDFQLYKEGILTAPCPTKIAHSVVAVGYDTAPDGTKYWILKNSWGEEWGDKGYVKMLRGAPEKEGYCGIAMQPCYPTIENTGDKHPGGGAVVQMSTEL